MRLGRGKFPMALGFAVIGLFSGLAPVQEINANHVVMGTGEESLENIYLDGSVDTHAWTVVRMNDDEETSYNLTLAEQPGDATDKRFAFHRFSVLTDSDYQLGVSLRVVGYTMDKAVLTAGIEPPLAVFMRNFSSPYDLYINQDQTSSGGDYLAAALPQGVTSTGVWEDDFEMMSRAHSVIASKQVTVQVDDDDQLIPNRMPFAFPPLLDPDELSNRCIHQFFVNPVSGETDTRWLSFDIYSPLATDEAEQTALTVEVTFVWEDTRLQPPDPLNPLDRPIPVLELPRVVVTRVAESDDFESLSTITDNYPCDNEAQFTVRWDKPLDERFVDFYDIYVVGPTEDQEPTAYPGTGNPGSRYKTVAKQDPDYYNDQDQGYTVEFDRINIDSVTFFVWVVAVNSATYNNGLDLYGAHSDIVTVVGGDCSSSKYASSKDPAEKQSSIEGGESNREQERALNAAAWGSNNKFLDIKRDTPSDVHGSPALPRTRSSFAKGRAREKYIFPSGVQNGAIFDADSSGYQYKRTISGELLQGTASRHQFSAVLSDMSAYKLTISSTSSTTTAVTGVFVMRSSLNECPGAELSVEEMEQLGFDDDHAWWAGLNCPENTQDETTTPPFVTHDVVCSDPDGTGTTVTGTTTFTIEILCTDIGDPLNDITIVVVGSGMTGTYTLTWESTDYHASRSVQIAADVQLTQPISVDSKGWSVALEPQLLAYLQETVRSVNMLSEAVVTLVSFLPAPATVENQTMIAKMVVSGISGATHDNIDTLVVSLEDTWQTAWAKVDMPDAERPETVSLLARPQVVVKGCLESGDQRTVSVTYSGCAHPIASIASITSPTDSSGLVRGLLLRRNVEPTFASRDAAASYPSQSVSTQLLHCASSSTAAVGPGVIYGKVFVLESDSSPADSFPEVTGAQVFTVALSLSALGGHESGSQEGFVCCDQLLLYRFVAPANQQLVVRLTSQMHSSGTEVPAAGRLEALLMTPTECPKAPNSDTFSGEPIFCDLDPDCRYTNTPSVGDDGSLVYSVSTTRGEVTDTTSSEWCVGVKAFSDSVATTKHAVQFVLENIPFATPAPTIPPANTFDDCTTQDIFCRRDYRLPNRAPRALSGTAIVTTFGFAIASAALRRIFIFNHY